MVSDALLTKNPVPVQVAAQPIESPKQTNEKSDVSALAIKPPELTKGAVPTIAINGLPASTQISVSGSIQRYQSVEKLRQSQSEESSRQFTRSQRGEERSNPFRKSYFPRSRYNTLALGLGLASMSFLSSYFLWLGILPFNALMPGLSLSLLALGLHRYFSYRRVLRGIRNAHSFRPPSSLRRHSEKNEEVKSHHENRESTVNKESTEFKFQINTEQQNKTPTPSLSSQNTESSIEPAKSLGQVPARPEL